MGGQIFLNRNNSPYTPRQMAFQQSLNELGQGLGQAFQQKRDEEKQETERQRALNQYAMEKSIQMHDKGFNASPEQIKAELSGEAEQARAYEAQPGFEGPPRPGLFDRRTEEYMQKQDLAAQQRQKAEQDRELNRQYKQAQMGAMAQSQKAKKQESAIKGIDSLRKEVSSLPATKETIQLDTSLRKIRAADATPAGDISMIFNFMKMNDPGSVVREGEFATAQNAAGVPDRIRNQYNAMLSGTRLNPEQREDFKTQAFNLANAQLESYKTAIKPYMTTAETRGLPQEQIFPQFDFSRPQPAQLAQQNYNIPPGLKRMEIAGQPQIPGPTNPFSQAVDAIAPSATAAPAQWDQNKENRLLELYKKAGR